MERVQDVWRPSQGFGFKLRIENFMKSLLPLRTSSGEGEASPRFEG